MFQRKKKDEEKKNPFTREYSLLSNIHFIFSNMFRYQKALIWLVPLPILIHPVTAYLWTFVSLFCVTYCFYYQANKLFGKNMVAYCGSTFADYSLWHVRKLHHKTVIFICRRGSSFIQIWLWNSFCTKDTSCSFL